MIPILLFVMAHFRPASPTIGDPITMQFQGPVVLDPSPNYEIVSRRGDTVVIRTFQPHPFTVSGSVAGVRFHDMNVPVKSVLKPNDKMDPAPLKPPRTIPYPRLPFVAIGIAAFAAIAAWTAAALRRDAAVARAVPLLPPAEQFRAAINTLRRNPNLPLRWSKLADALRDYLAETSPLSHDMTTTEVIERSGSEPMAEILRQGDLEKFSPWGPLPANFDAIAQRALALVPEPADEVAA